MTVVGAAVCGRADSTPAEAARLPEQGLAVACPDDYETTARARLLLGSLYRKLRREAEAEAQERAARSLSHAR